MKKTCLPLVSMFVQRLACPGGGNKLLWLLYHHLLMLTVCHAPQLLIAWHGEDDYILKKHQVFESLSACSKEESPCAVSHPCCENITGTGSSEAAHFWQPLSSYILVLQVNPSSTLLAFLPSSLKSLSSLEIKEKTGGGNKWMLSRKQSIK